MPDETRTPAEPSPVTVENFIRAGMVNAQARASVRTVLASMADDDAIMELGRRAIEKALVDIRDVRKSEFTRNNGLVIREKNGTASDVIRFGPETAVRIALKAIAEHLAKMEEP